MSTLGRGWPSLAGGVGLRWIDDAMVRLMGKNEGGEHGTTNARVTAGGVGIERSMSRRAAQGTDVAEPTSVARSARVARDFDSTLPKCHKGEY